MSGDRDIFINVEGDMVSAAVVYYNNFPYEAAAAAAACTEMSERWTLHEFSKDIAYALRIGMAEFPPESDGKRNVKMFYFMTPLMAAGFKPTKEDIDRLYGSLTQKTLKIMKSMAHADDCDITAVIMNPPADMLPSLDAFLHSQ